MNNFSFRGRFRGANDIDRWEDTAHITDRQIDIRENWVRIWFTEQALNPWDIEDIAKQLEKFANEKLCTPSPVRSAVRVRPRDVQFYELSTDGTWGYQSKYIEKGDVPEDEDEPEIISIHINNNTTDYSVEGLPLVTLKSIEEENRLINVAVCGDVDLKDRKKAYLLTCVMNRALREKRLGKFKVSPNTILKYNESIAPNVREKYGTHCAIFS